MYTEEEEEEVSCNMPIKNLTKSQLLQKQRRRQRYGRDQEWRQGRQLRSFLAAIDQPRLGEDFDSNFAFFGSAHQLLQQSGFGVDLIFPATPLSLLHSF